MKFVTKLLFATVVLFLITSFISHSEATASSKIYREYKLPADRTKFPITLTNGLKISSKIIGDSRIPVISKNNTPLWEGVVGYIPFMGYNNV